ncbi:MAG TPA: hypothetical protein VGX78_10510 [Pirellulales bacterium]|nr:hypothetical protein [Pirellulales bacterium]
MKSDGFDPYRKWLAIPEDSRPPTHYQLLGISPEEQDRDVIDTAVIRQSAFVRNFQTGKHAEHATRLLNEIAAAQVCLNDKAKRAQYDAELKKKGLMGQPSMTPDAPQTARQAPRAAASTELRSPHVVQPATSASGAMLRGQPAPRAAGRGAQRPGLGSGVTALDDLLGANIPAVTTLRTSPQKAPAYYWQVPLALALVAMVAIIGYVAITLGNRPEGPLAAAALDIAPSQSGATQSNPIPPGPIQPGGGAPLGKPPSAPGTQGAPSGGAASIPGNSAPAAKPNAFDAPASVPPAKDDPFVDGSKSSPAAPNADESTGATSVGPSGAPSKLNSGKSSTVEAFGPKAAVQSVAWPKNFRSDFEGVDLEAGFQSKVVFAEGTSPFVAVDGVVWNLSKSERTGRTGAKGGAAFDLEALSSDGKFYAQSGGIGDPTVVVYTCDKGQVHKRLPFQKAGTNVQFVGFAPPVRLKVSDDAAPRLITAASWAFETRVQVWSLDTGKMINEYKTPDLDFDDVAMGLDGKHFAAKLAKLDRNKGLAIYDLKTGKLAAKPRFSGKSTWGAEAMQFAPDGQELAALDELGLHLTVWDGTTSVVFEAETGKNDRHGWERDIGYQGPPIEWLPDGSGWLLYGRYLLDRSSRRVVWKLEAGTHHRFRFLDQDHLAVVRGKFGGSNKLVGIAIPWKLIHAALAGNASQREALPIVESLQ